MAESAKNIWMGVIGVFIMGFSVVVWGTLPDCFRLWPQQNPGTFFILVGAVTIGVIALCVSYQHTISELNKRIELLERWAHQHNVEDGTIHPMV